MAVNAKLIKELRDITQAGMMDCKKALEATDGDIDNAIIWLRENGLAKAAKKTDRVAAEGIVFAKENVSKAINLEINSETDFVAKNETFLTLVNNIADTLLNSDAKTLQEALSLVMPNGQTIEQNLVSATATIGEKIVLRRFVLINKNSRSTAIYNHANKRVSVLLIFDKNIDKQDGYNVAMHVAAMSPKYINMEQIPAEFKDQEMHIIKEQAKDDVKLQGKPENVLENILKGKLTKRLAEVSLLDQVFVVDENFKVGQFLSSKKTNLVEMIRYEVGEGIEKVSTNFAEEVAAQLGK